MIDTHPARSATDVAAPQQGVGPLLPGSQREARPLRQQILEHVRAAGRAARADITRALGVSAGSVTTLTSELIGLGLLREVETAAATPTARGRPPVALELVSEGRLVIGIKISDERNTAVLADFAGTILADAARPAPPMRRSLEQTCDEIDALIDAVLAQAGRPRKDLLAVGVGLSGMVDHETGTVLWSPHLGPDMPLGAEASRRFGLPVLVDNDANMLTLAELWFGVGRQRSDFAVVTIEHGVGMGLVIDNRLYRGERSMGLELGHTKVQLDGALCRCGKRGCLEAYIADYALAREAATALNRAPQSPQVMLDALYAEAKSGNRAARSIFNRAGRYLALGLSNVIQLFDPELVILSGERMRYDYLYADGVLAEMRALTLVEGREPARIEIHAWGDLVWARGASALALAAVTETVLAGARAT
ncbi:MAG: putative NBD/HSP70 family sugar kinase [Limimaricola cinnabarinus]|jgi:predicted NBD/HSP70 family sugar kinase|uniref:Xylose-responsive transcription regulator, ROK family n=1 Tax=Limimaricola cinnabarinus LL-001 TaxID=1337093 RepID=U2Z4F4_9RHOB|nr:ROK family protein [Limimaricola cinnabarinus]GAD55942.1 xylose-responsive transcription regulator, ROK family [Limimaricola cinnabarinus LL-001]